MLIVCSISFIVITLVYHRPDTAKLEKMHAMLKTDIKCGIKSHLYYTLAEEQLIALILVRELCFASINYA